MGGEKKQVQKQLMLSMNTDCAKMWRDKIWSPDEKGVKEEKEPPMKNEI